MASLDLTKPIQTRAGLKVRIVCTDYLGHGNCPILGLITRIDGSEFVMAYSTKGQCSVAAQDLVNTPEKRWINVWRHPSTRGGDVISGTFSTPESAAKNADRQGHLFIKTIEVDLCP